MANWLFVATLSGFLSVGPQPEAKPDAYIRALLPQDRQQLILLYSSSALMYSGFIKFHQPPGIYIHCPVDGCAPNLPGMIADLRSQVPDAFGEQVTEPDAAQIEIYIASESGEFDRRDRKIDKRLHANAHVGSKFLLPPRPAPCRSTIYFDLKRSVIEKAMIFIDQDASSRMQYLCMGFETVRALGVISIPEPLFYQDLEKRVMYDPLPYLSANAFLHSSTEIRAGAPMEQALAVLRERYGVQ